MKKYLNKIIFIFLFMILPISVFADIKLDKNQYSVWDHAHFITSGGPYEIYNLTMGKNLGGDEEYSSDSSSDYHWLLLDKISENQYSLVEMTEPSICEQRFLSYEECKSLPEFVGEFRFSVLKGPDTGGASLPIPSSSPEPSTPAGGGGPTAYRPEVEIYSPLEDKTYGNLVDVIYEATDKNDELGQKHLGLSQFPVTIYYSKSSDIRQMVQLGSNLPPKGVFKWDTKDLPEGDTYNIIIDATDNSGETGESVSGDFVIDHTIPVFTIKTDPAVTRGEDVKIIVESTKELSEVPSVKVAQNEFNFMDVLMQGSGKHFEGVYKVIGGYDGPAEITISGKDLSGNVSNLIADGGIFSVGVLPPPKPVILSPIDKEIASTGVINIKGKARKDTEVILSVNGLDKFSTNPDKEGLFYFSNIKLRPEFNYGGNIISIISKDAARNISESANLTIKYNLPPEIFIDSPVAGQTLGTTTLISVKASDKNRDKLKFDYEVSRDKGANWINIADSASTNQYNWDTTFFSDGDYYLRVTVNDGTSKKSVTVENLIVKNLLPTFSFEGGDRFSTNKKEFVISGTVSSSVKTSPRSNIVSAEYSLDNGENWTNISFNSGSDLSGRKFSFNLSGLEEKNYNIKFRAKDDRGIFGRGQKSLIVIFEPPVSPTGISIKNGDIIDSSMDKNRDVAGVQINISGNSKPRTIVKINTTAGIFSGNTDDAGKFVVSGVTIRNHGNNLVSFFAEDEAGNRSPSTEISILYNNPPIIKFLNPRSGRGLNHKTNIEFDVYDPDGDSITKTVLSYKSPDEKVFRPLDVNSIENKFEFDVSNFKEGYGYSLRLDTTDGISNSSKTIEFFVDNTPPLIDVDAIKERNFKKDFKFEATGSAADNLSGIEFIEYSLDEEHWFKAVINKGYLTNRAEFRLRHPFSLDDGEYEIKLRAVDSSGNMSLPWRERIVVDTMPPRVGSFELSSQNIVLYPENGIFEVLGGANLKIRLSAEFDTKEIALSFGSNEVMLLQNPSSGLWEGDIKIDQIGEYPIRYSAKDSFGNFVEDKSVGGIQVLKGGSIKKITTEGSQEEFVSDAKITVMIFDDENQRFIRWPGEFYGLNNPVSSLADGSYYLLLPSGKFMINVNKPGFVNLKTSEFDLLTPKFIYADFSIKKREGIRGYVEDFLDKFVIF